MSSDKIIITETEVNRTEVPRAPRLDPLPPPVALERSKTPIILWICVAAVAMFVGIAGITAVVLISTSTATSIFSYTVSDFCRDLEKKTNDELQNPDHPVRKRVEMEHLTVSVYQAHVSNLEVQTKDGSNNVGRDLSNVRSVSCDFTLLWNGIIHKGGRTVVHYEYECIDGKLHFISSKNHSGEIIYTDALITISDPKFWETIALIILAW